jgi:hypothetical protein
MASTTRNQRSRDASILRERIAGAKLQQIARRHRMSIEGVRAIAAKEGERHITDLIRRMRENTKTGRVEVLLVPNGPDLAVSLAYARWVLAQLSDRRVLTRVRPRVVPNGVAFGLELEDADHAEEAQ